MNPKKHWSGLPILQLYQSSENIIQARPTVKPEVSSAASHLSAWNVFSSDDMITAIIDSTNKKIWPKVILAQNKTEFYYKRNTDHDEIKDHEILQHRPAEEQRLKTLSPLPAQPRPTLPLRMWLHRLQQESDVSNVSRKNLAYWQRGKKEEASHDEPSYECVQDVPQSCLQATLWPNLWDCSQTDKYITDSTNFSHAITSIKKI